MSMFLYCFEKLADEMLDPEPAPAPVTPLDGPPALPPKRKNPYLEAGKVLGGSVGGFALGYGSGALMSKLIGDAIERRGGEPAHLATKIAPFAMGAAGMIYPMWRAAEQKEMSDAAARARDENARRVPSE